MVRLVATGITTTIVGELPSDVRIALDQELSYFVKGYNFSPRFQAGQWDGRYHCLRENRFPTGLLMRVMEFLHTQDVMYELDEQRPEYAKSVWRFEGRGLELRDYQADAVSTMKVAKYGIASLPPRAGKTVIATRLMAELGLSPAIFLCERIDLAIQTRKVLRERLPEQTIGLAGDGVWEPGDVVVATVQSLASAFGQKPDKEEGWDPEKPFTLQQTKLMIKKLVESAKIVIADEVHHAASSTYTYLLKRMPATEYRIGISATPFREDNRDLNMEANIGPVAYSISYSYLIEHGFLVPPHIHFIDLPSNPREDEKAYTTLYSERITHNDRRNRIIEKCARQLHARGRNVLIIVRHIAHGKDLEKRLKSLKAVLLTGKESTAVRTSALDSMRRGRQRLTISTLFDEAVDVPCLPTGSLVMTPEGPLPIEHVSVTVIGGSGLERKVTSNMCRDYKGVLVELKVCGTPFMYHRMTPEHEVLVAKASRKKIPWHKSGVKYSLYWKPGDLQWLPASQVQEGDYVAIPSSLSPQKGPYVLDVASYSKNASYNEKWCWSRHCNNKIRWYGGGVLRVRRFIRCCPDFCRLLGYFVAEGDFSGGSVTFTFHKNEVSYIEDVRKLCAKFFGVEKSITVHTTGNASQLRICSVLIGRLFTRLCLRGARNKQVPHVVMLGTLEEIREFIRGYWRGDGSLGGKDSQSVKFSTSSASLALQVRLLLARTGVFGSVTCAHHHKHEEYTVSCVGTNGDKLLSFLGERGVFQREKKSHTQAIFREGYMLMPVSERKDVAYSGKVWNLSVDVDESYLLPGMVVHNCLDSVIIAAGGDSAIKAFQRLRALTPSPGKTFCTIVDFLDKGKYLGKHARKRFDLYSSEPAFEVRNRSWEEFD